LSSNNFSSIEIELLIKKYQVGVEVLLDFADLCWTNNSGVDVVSQVGCAGKERRIHARHGGRAETFQNEKET
jgi:hypothetical protein